MSFLIIIKKLHDKYSHFRILYISILECRRIKMIIKVAGNTKECVWDYYTADSVVLLNRVGMEKVDGKFVNFTRTDAISVLNNKNDHQFVVQFLTGYHKGEIYGLRYKKSAKDDGSFLNYGVSQAMLLAGVENLPQELQYKIKKIEGKDAIIAKEIAEYVKTINKQSLNKSIADGSQSQPE